MRILVVGAAGAERTESSLARAARTLGHEARVLDALGWRRRLGEAGGLVLRWQADRFAPDLVLCTRHAASAGERTLRHLVRGRRSAFWYFDAVQPLPGRVVTLARGVDAVFATYGYQVEAFRALRLRAEFLPQGADPALDRPAETAPSAYHCDLAFVGSGDYPRRHAVLTALARHFTLQVRGPGWAALAGQLPVAGGTVRAAEFARVARGARLMLGVDALEAQRAEARGGTSNRLWRVLAAGGCYLGEYVDNVEEFARHGVHALWYRHPADAVELARGALADDAQRARLAAAGRAHVLAQHTYAHRLQRLLAGQGYTST
ncbi:MAG: glycosyltransferase [Gemmatimonadetes bacterium]|nr:glycosyltransferase [Gemmatimonadota bacterium]